MSVCDVKNRELAIKKDARSERVRDFVTLHSRNNGVL